MNKENLHEFEKTLLDQEKTHEIKYVIDKDIESQVRYEFMCESAGIENVDKALNDSGMEKIDLADDESYRTILNILLAE